eukprot:SAG31_NODE_759_length_12288_cov_5.890475_3_plen_165_part_00
MALATIIIWMALAAARAVGATTTTVKLPAAAGAELQCADSGTLTTRCLGVRYEAAQRWRRPALAELSGRNNATTYWPACPGCGWPGERTSEDCLYLNVFAPRRPRSSLAPVLVWIHGGAYSGGSTHGFDGTPHVEAANGDLVWVTIEYRLNVFGFLGSEALKST